MEFLEHPFFPHPPHPLYTGPDQEALGYIRVGLPPPSLPSFIPGMWRNARSHGMMPRTLGAGGPPSAPLWQLDEESQLPGKLGHKWPQGLAWHRSPGPCQEVVEEPSQPCLHQLSGGLCKGGFFSGSMRLLFFNLLNKTRTIFSSASCRAS